MKILFQYIKSLMLFLLMVCLSQTFAQNIPNGTIVPPTPTQTVLPTPAAYSSGVYVNYVRSRVAQAPITNEAAFANANYTQVKQVTEYCDGLGRPIQTVAQQASTTNKDVVSYNVYDEFGRETVKYLPYVDAATDGRFKLNPFTNQHNFNAAQFAGEQVFYAQTIFEASPLNRPLKSMAAGNSWAGSNRGVSLAYEINEDNEVRLWEIDYENNFPITNISYNREMLYKIITTDEHNKQVIEYKDKEGKVILKKVQIDDNPSFGLGGSNYHIGWLCTYYVYDDFGLLRFVIPPKAVEYLLANNWSFTGANGEQVMNELCFQYTYDARNRMITKKVPGAGWVYMVYDQRDRLVMTQDANLRSQGKWLVTQYENQFNRPIATYLLTDFLPHTLHQSSASNSAAYPSIASAELLTQTYYDNYDWLNQVPELTNLNTTDLESSPYYIAPSNSSAPYAQMLTQNTTALGQATGSKIKVLGTNDYTYSVSYYDDRGRVIQSQATQYGGGITTTTTQYDFVGKPLVSLLHHTKPNVGDMYVTSVFTYDDGGRLIESKKDINGQGLKTITKNSYNELGQLIRKQLGKDITEDKPVETLDYTYNIRGWLTGVNRGFANPLYAAEFATQNDRWFGFQLSYDYGFDNASASGGVASNGYFNGNISGQVWKSKSNHIQRAYGYTYDAANRLMTADFNENVPQRLGGSGDWLKDKKDFSVTMGNGIDPRTAYDANGNILAMQQKGVVENDIKNLDQLEYSYYDNSNKLKSVYDAYNNFDSKEGDFKTSPNHPNVNATSAAAKTDYEYDANGNLTQDFNKDIQSGAIEYNHLNLPKKITIANKGTIEYVYDATGNKLSKIVTELATATTPTTTTKTEYINGFVYETKSPTSGGVEVTLLKHFAHEEGRFRLGEGTIITTKNTPSGSLIEPSTQTVQNAGVWVADYFIKDHLGNVRMTLTEETKITDRVIARLEDNTLPWEGKYFSNLSPEIKDNLFDQNPENQRIDELPPGNGNTVSGMGILLKVQAGDRIKTSVFAHYKPNTFETIPPTPSTIANEIANGINTSFARQLGNESATLISQANANWVGSILQFITSASADAPNSDDVLAHLNYIMLSGENLSFTPEQSGFEQVPHINLGDEKILIQANEGEYINIEQNGYMYIFVSNSSLNKGVRFDDLLVSRERSALLEETHYYPFGLAMSGISSKATGSLKSKLKYNSYEEGTDFDINLNESFYRLHDPQIGRFWQIDPKVNELQGSYNAMGNNPIKNFDVLGDILRGVNETSAQRTLDLITQTFKDNGCTDALINLFSISKEDGVTFNSIDGTAFENAIADLDEDAQAIARGYYKSVNSEDIFFTSIINSDKGETVDLSTAKDISKNLFGNYDGKKASEIEDFSGGQNSGYFSKYLIANTTKKGQSLVVVDLANKGVMSDVVTIENYSASFVANPAMILNHELNGHALMNQYLGDANGSNNQAIRINAIRLDNAYFRMTNSNLVRTGSSHTGIGDGKPGPIMSRLEATIIPHILSTQGFKK